MRKIALLGASALVLAISVAGASAEPFNPITNTYGDIKGPGYGYGYGYDAPMNEGRAAAVDRVNPFFGPMSGYAEPSAPGSVVLQQFREGK